jgi:hypothetical protein
VTKRDRPTSPVAVPFDSPPASIRRVSQFGTVFFHKVTDDKVSPKAYSVAYARANGHTFHVVFASKSNSAPRRPKAQMTDMERKKSDKKRGEQRAFGSYPTVDAFVAMYVETPASIRCFYQVLPADRPIAFFVDFDKTVESADLVRQWTRGLLLFMSLFAERVRLLGSLGDASLDGKSPDDGKVGWVPLNRHRKKGQDAFQLSTHLLDLLTWFENIPTMGLFMETMFPGTDDCPKYDDKIYSRDRNFLMAYSFKAQTPTPFVPTTVAGLHAVADGLGDAPAEPLDAASFKRTLVPFADRPPAGAAYVTMAMVLRYIHRSKEAKEAGSKEQTTVVMRLMKRVDNDMSYDDLVSFFRQYVRKTRGHAHDTERHNRMDVHHRYDVVRAVPTVTAAQAGKSVDPNDNIASVIDRVLEGFFGSVPSMPP